MYGDIPNMIKPTDDYDAHLDFRSLRTILISNRMCINTFQNILKIGSLI